MKLWLSVGLAVLAIAALGAVATALFWAGEELDQRNCLQMVELEYPAPTFSEEGRGTGIGGFTEEPGRDQAEEVAGYLGERRRRRVEDC